MPGDKIDKFLLSLVSEVGGVLLGDFIFVKSSLRSCLELY